MKGRYAPKDENGHSVWQQGGYWFAYANLQRDEISRGKGRTKQEAIENSIKNTEN